MASWFGQGGHLYNIFHLDEFQQAIERQENTAEQDYELHDLRPSLENLPPTTTSTTTPLNDESSSKSSTSSTSSFIHIPSPTSTPSTYLSTSDLDRGHRLGNFWNYPTYNPAEKRMELIPEGFFERIGGSVESKLTYIDLGCNEGELTLSFWSHLLPHTSHPSSALGIDIDPTLINRAQTRSLAGDILRGGEQSIRFVDGDVSDLKFLGEEIDKLESSRVTLISLFSTTMWLHVHLGDSGLKLFLVYVLSRCNFFLVEPQPKKCYTSVNRRLRRMGREEVDMSAIDLDNVEEFVLGTIDECGFKRVKEEENEEETETHWNRRLILFKRKDL